MPVSARKTNFRPRPRGNPGVLTTQGPSNAQAGQAGQYRTGRTSRPWRRRRHQCLPCGQISHPEFFKTGGKWTTVFCSRYTPRPTARYSVAWALIVPVAAVAGPFLSNGVGGCRSSSRDCRCPAKRWSATWSSRRTSAGKSTSGMTQQSHGPAGWSPEARFRQYS